MTWLLVIAVFLGIAHWAYQSMVAPTNLIIIREKFRILKMDLEAVADRGVADVDRQALRLVRDELDDHMRYASELGVGAAWIVWRAHKRHPEIIREARKNLKIITSCGNPDIRAIHERSLMLATGATLSNSLPMILYLAIPLVVVLLFAFIKGSAMNKLDGIAAYYAKRHRRAA